MYKVFLADDNALSREAMKKSALWKKYGCRIVGEAENGTEALEKLRLLKPDLAFMDIKMPGLSGLEVIEQLKKEQLDCLFILVTAYDDFSFARQGLKMGVFDYLLKPVEDKEMQEVVRKATERLDCSRKLSRQENARRLLECAVRGDVDACAELLTLCREGQHCLEYCILLLTADRRLQDAELMPAIRKCSDRLNLRLISAEDREGTVLCCSFGESLLAKDYELTALKAANILFGAMKEQGLKPVLAISEVSRETGELPKLYEHTVFARNSRFFLENQEIVHYESLHSKSIRREYEMMESLQEFYLSCRRQSEQMPENLEHFLSLIRKQDNYDAEYVRGILVQTGIMMTCLMREKGMEAGTMDAEGVIRELSACQTAGEACELLRSYARSLSGMYEDLRGYSVQTRRILDYMNQNFRHRLTLQDVAGALLLSEAHICRVLKHDTGETFVTLLNKIRIREAVRLLHAGNLKVYEVAEATGFSNYAYFYQLFKKETGQSPTELQ